MEKIIRNGREVGNVYIDKHGEIKRIDYETSNYTFSTDGEIAELCVYANGFITPKHTSVNQEIFAVGDDLQTFECFMNTRKFKREGDVAVPLNNTVSMNDFIKSMRRGGRRATQTFFDYALANKWEYFVTLTIEEQGIRNSRELVIFYWQKFVNYLKKYSKEAKAIAVLEEHKDGGYHMHALVADCDLALVTARNNKKTSKEYRQFMYTDFGDQIFNTLDWKLGFNTVVIIRKDTYNAQIVNYMSKYMLKSSCVPYGCKRFYHTQNLVSREGYCGKALSFNDWLEKFGMKLAKVTKNGIAIYRNYGSKFIDKEKNKEEYVQAEAIINSAINIGKDRITGVEDINDKPLSEIIKDKIELEDVTDINGLAFEYQQTFDDIAVANLDKIFEKIKE